MVLGDFSMSLGRLSERGFMAKSGCCRVDSKAIGTIRSVLLEWLLVPREEGSIRASGLLRCQSLYEICV